MKFAGFCLAVIALPFVGQIDPATTAGRLAVGGAQAVLAVLVVSLALALVRVFILYRRDMKEENERIQEYMQESGEKLQKIVTDNTVAMKNLCKIVETCSRRRD